MGHGLVPGDGWSVTDATRHPALLPLFPTSSGSTVRFHYPARPMRHDRQVAHHARRPLCAQEQATQCSGPRSRSVLQLAATARASVTQSLHVTGGGRPQKAGTGYRARACCLREADMFLSG
jgi:hypothetical protein